MVGTLGLGNRPMMIAGSRPVPGPNFDANLKFWKCLKV